MGVLLDNPIAAVQFQVRGGWRTFLVLLGGYAVLVGGAIACTLTFSVSPAGATMRNWSTGLLVLQAILVLLTGLVRISSAVRQDRLLNTIESHRLMPIDGRVALAGYIIGAGAPFLGLFVVTTLLGCITIGIAGMDQIQWIACNLILLSFACFVWIISASAAMGGRALPALLVLCIFGAVFSQGLMLYAVPAVMVLVTPLMGSSIFTLSADSSMGGLMVGLFAQAAIASVMIALSVKKFRRPDVPALSSVLALLLLVIWIAISLAAWRYWEQLAWNGLIRVFGWRSAADVRPKAQFIGSALSAMIFVNICFAVRPDRRALSSLTRRFEQAAVLSACLLLVNVLLIIPASVATSLPLAAVALSLSLMVIDMLCLMAMFPSSAPSRGIFSLIVLAALWIAPLIADVVMATDDSKQWTIGMISPIAAMQAPWISKQPLMFGVTWQLGIAGVLAVLGGAATLRRSRSSVNLSGAVDS